MKYNLTLLSPSKINTVHTSFVNPVYTSYLHELVFFNLIKLCFRLWSIEGFIRPYVPYMPVYARICMLHRNLRVVFTSVLVLLHVKWIWIYCICCPNNLSIMRCNINFQNLPWVSLLLACTFLHILLAYCNIERIIRATFFIFIFVICLVHLI